MDYFILFFSFVATLVALFGDSRKNNKLSFWGYIALIIAVISFIFSCIKSHQDSIEKVEEKNSFAMENKKKDSYLEKINSQTKTANDSIKSLHQELKYSKLEITNLKDKVEAYKELLDKVSKESERQPQWIFLNFYNLAPNKTIEMPNRVYSGSLLKFVGVCDGLILRYGSKRLEIPSFHYSSPLEIPIMGQSGISYQWSVENVSSNNCDFKVYILSTPRSRSPSASWLEEEQEQTKQDLFFSNMLQYIFNGNKKDKLNVGFLNVRFVDKRNDLEMITRNNKKIQPIIMFYAQYGNNATAEGDYFFSNLKRDFFIYLEKNNYRNYSVEDKTWMSDIHPDKYWINKLYKSTNGKKSFYFRYEQEKSETMGYSKFIIGK